MDASNWLSANLLKLPKNILRISTKEKKDKALMTIWKTPLVLADLQKTMRKYIYIASSDCFHRSGETIISRRQMPLGPHLMQPIGIMHGGASCSFAETVANAAAGLLCRC
jgi:hypothetical protein